MFTRALYLSLSWNSSNQSIRSLSISLKSILILSRIRNLYDLQDEFWPLYNLVTTVHKSLTGQWHLLSALPLQLKRLHCTAWTILTSLHSLRERPIAKHNFQQHPADLPLRCLTTDGLLLLLALCRETVYRAVA
jgi:hypothetical protein